MMHIKDNITGLNDNPKPASANPLEQDTLPKFKRLIPEAPGTGREHDVVMVYLDTLLDTVLGTVALRDPALAVKLLDSKRYRTRVLDQFAHITHKEFQELYAKRDEDTLKASMLTNVPYFLQRIIKDCMVHSANTDMKQELTFVINTYPYHLGEELSKMLAECGRYHTFATSEVQVVRIADEDLKPSYIRTELDIIVRYQYKDWLYMHREEFDRCLCPNVALVVPQIFQEGMIDDEGMLTCKRIGKSPFEIAEQVVANIIRLKIMPVSMFCVNEKITKENAANIILGLSIQPEDIEAAAKEKGLDLVEEPLMKEHDMNDFSNHNDENL